jgi:hypothetical protein
LLSSLMRLIVQLYERVRGEYNSYGVSTSSRLMLIEAVPGTDVGEAVTPLLSYF